jgi:NADPH:quinone reductase-like Zn-dependent oxidoreductase
MTRCHGVQVVAVCSSRHHKYVTQTLGADQAVDYKTTGWMDAIASEPANKGMLYAFDAISGPATKLCDNVLEMTGAAGKGVIATTSPDGMPGLASEIKGINLGTAYTDLREELAGHVKLVQGLLEEGKVVPNRVKVVGGLEQVKEAFEMMKAGGVSGEKLVVKI